MVDTPHPVEVRYQFSNPDTAEPGNGIQNQHNEVGVLTANLAVVTKLGLEVEVGQGRKRHRKMEKHSQPGHQRLRKKLASPRQ